MKTLLLLLNQYNEGKISLNEMVELINEFGVYAGYKSAYGKQTLKATINGQLVEVSNENTNINNYKFDPLKHGFEPVSKFPELSYRFPMRDDVWFIKVITYSTYDGKLVYWYVALSLSVGLHPDDRVKITIHTHDNRKPNDHEKQGVSHTVYTGLISSDEFAKELLTHLFGTTQNDSVKTDGLERYEKNLNQLMRDDLKTLKNKLSINGYQ